MPSSDTHMKSNKQLEAEREEAKKPKAKPGPKKKAAPKLLPWQGPFGDYTFVHAPSGEYGVSPLHVLEFTYREKLNVAAGVMEKVAVPHQRPATDEELEEAGLMYLRKITRSMPGDPDYEYVAPEDRVPRFA